MSSKEPSVVSDVKVAAVSVLSVDVDVAGVVDYSLQSELEWPMWETFSPRSWSGRRSWR